jgi:hypothetical protein
MRGFERTVFKRTARKAYGFGATVVISYVLYLILPQMTLSTKICSLRYENNLVNGIFFGVLTTANSPRQSVAYNLWVKKVNNKYPHQAAFLCNEGPYIPDVRYIKMNETEYNITRYSKDKWIPDRDRAMKRYIGARYFLEHTNLKWYWCASDDNIIDVDKIDAMAYYFDVQYDTEKDYVFKGHCMSISENETFLQGGIGYFYSRKAAQRFVNEGMEYWKNTEGSDDVIFDRYIKMFGLTIRQISTRHMFGHFQLFQFNSSDYFDNNVSKCPDEIGRPYTECYGREIFPANDLIGLHDSNITNGIENYKIFKNATQYYNDLYYYFDNCELYFCRATYTNIMSVVSNYDNFVKPFI